MIRSAPASPQQQQQQQQRKQPRYVPICESCGHKMRPTKIEPHVRLRNIHVRTLACDCGNTARDVVAGIG